MRRIGSLLIAIVVLILIMSSIPFLTGWFFKQKYFDIIQSLNADTEIKFHVREYHLGWRHSFALVDVTFPNPILDNASTHFVLEQSIEHGPIIFHENGDFPENTIFQYALINGVVKKDSKAMMNIATDVSYQGVFNNLLSIPGLELSFPLFGKFVWQGANGTISFKAARDHLEYATFNLNIEPILFQSPLGLLNVSKMHVQNDFHYLKLHSFKGSNQFSIPSLIFDFFGYDIRLGKMQLTHFFNVENNQYDSKTNITLQQLAIPNLTLSPFSTTFTLNHFNFEALRHFMKILKNDASLELFLKSITLQSELSSTVDFSTPEGKFHLDFKGKWPEKAFPLRNNIFNQMNYEINIVAEKALINHIVELVTESTPKVAQTKPLTFEDQLNVLVEQKSISTYAASQLKELVKTPLSSDAFVTALERLAMTNEISPDALDQLRQSYTAMQNTSSIPESQPVKTLSQELDDLIKQGYILQEKENYVVNIVNQNGIILINGKSEISFPSSIDVKAMFAPDTQAIR